MQQAEHITESEVDIEKKKQELYSEIDALGIKSDSRINKLKKFLADRKIWHLEEMDYPLRNSYEQYLRGQIRSQIVSFYLKIYDTVKQQHIYQQMQTLNGKRIYEWKYQNKIYFLKYYPEKEIAETFETSYKTNLLVWDFTQNCSEVLKKQIFYTLSRIIANTSMSKAYRNVRLKSLKLLYDSCVQLNITDIGLLEMEQVETILKNFPETSQRSILGECRRDAFMQQEQIQWEANVWYLERLHLGKHRIDESKSLISISFMEVKEIQNREILQAYMKYELGITGQAVSTIVRRFVCIRNFIELLEQEKILAIHATVAEVKKYADGLRERGIQAKGFNERIFGIGHFYKFMEVKQYITRMPFRIEYFQQKEVIVHHDRSVEETVYMEILKKLYLFPERLRCMFLHLWCLGLRASEVCTLKGNAYYQQGEDYWIQVYQVKMKNYKRIPIPQALYQIMKVYLKKHEIQPEEFIFKNSRGGACLYGTFRTQMIEACRENKIANGEYLFQSHDYRHTVATMFYDSHVSLQSIRDYLGHTYEEMTRQYIDYMPQRIAKANDEFFEMQGSSLQGELTIMRIFSEYLQKEYSKIKSCSEIDREVLEEFLIHLSTKDTSHSANSSYVISLRRQLETIGKIYSYERLEHLFINTDIPPEVNAEFRVYSDDEMKRLNAEITQMDVQIARCLLIHQMLGTRISDTLTLRPDCLTRENGQDMIEIYQVKTKRYKKPISKELAKLLQSSIEYTQEKFGDTEYIFVNEKEPDRPMQYMAIKTKVMSMIQEKQLKDDHGELFGFGTHMFRHYYGVKLTEMHLDDWTIARLLGHKRLNNVQHYRKMSNQRMADETREVRQRMSDIIYMSLARWGEEYEQIRQDD